MVTRTDQETLPIVRAARLLEQVKQIIETECPESTDGVMALRHIKDALVWLYIKKL